MNQSEYPHRADSVGEPASITVQEGGAVGVATASTQPAPSSPVRPQSNAPRERTDAATPGSIQPAGGPTQRGHTRRQNLAGIADALSDRDWAILRSVEAHRFLTTAQITRLHFADHAEASGPALTRRVLGRLRGRRLLTTLERRIGGVRAGSSGLVFCVDVVGDRLLRRDTNRPSRRRFSEPSTSFLRHTLTVAETHVSLVEADRAAKCQLVRCDIEPASWRTHVGVGGAQLVLKPDLYVETAVNADSPFVNSWFLEVDLGTEHLPTLMRKCHDYDAYYRSGTEQTEAGTFPLVVWIMSARDPAVAARRRHRLREAIEAGGRLDASLFRVVAPDEVLALVQNGGEQ